METKKKQPTQNVPNALKNPVMFHSLEYHVGDGAHILFFGLKEQIMSITKEMIIEFDPTDLEVHVGYWRDFESTFSLLTDLFTSVNFYAQKLEDYARSLEQPGYEFNKEKVFNEAIEYWRKKSENHPLLEKGTNDGK